MSAEFELEIPETRNCEESGREWNVVVYIGFRWLGTAPTVVSTVMNFMTT
jgi:hypothetical protein